MINSYFPRQSQTLSSRSVPKLSKCQLLWYWISLIFSHPFSGPLPSYWLHAQNISESSPSSPPPSALPGCNQSLLSGRSFQACDPAVSPQLSSKDEPFQMWDKPCHSTILHPGRGYENSTDLRFHSLSELISHLSPSLSSTLATLLPHNSLNKPRGFLSIFVKGSAGPHPEISPELCIHHYSWFSRERKLIGCVYIQNETSYKKLAHMIMEAVKSPGMLPASWGLRTAGGVNSGLSPKAGDPREPMVSHSLREWDWHLSWSSEAERTSSTFLHLSVLFRPVIDWAKPTHSDANLFQKHLHRQAQIHCLPRYLGILWSSQGYRLIPSLFSGVCPNVTQEGTSLSKIESLIL